LVKGGSRPGGKKPERAPGRGKAHGNKKGKKTPNRRENEKIGGTAKRPLGTDG